jgi:hypothetical protein
MTHKSGIPSLIPIQLCNTQNDDIDRENKQSFTGERKTCTTDRSNGIVTPSQSYYCLTWRSNDLHLARNDLPPPFIQRLAQLVILALYRDSLPLILDLDGRIRMLMKSAQGGNNCLNAKRKLLHEIVPIVKNSFSCKPLDCVRYNLCTNQTTNLVIFFDPEPVFLCRTKYDSNRSNN